MLTLLLVAALAATALGSPGGEVLRSRSIDDAPYMRAVYKKSSYQGPGAIISEKFVVTAASIIGDTPASKVKVRSVDTILGINHLGDAVPAVNIYTAYGVSIIELQTTSSGATAKLTGDVEAGSLGLVSGWSWTLGLVPKVRTADVWLVLPEYCEDGAGLCATGSIEVGSPLTVDGNLVGLANTDKGDLVSYVSLTTAEVQAFINNVLYDDNPPATPGKPGTTTRSPAPTTSKPDVKPTTEKPKPIPGKQCKIDVNGGLPTGQPILLRDQTVLSFLEPDTGSTITLESGDRVRMACTGKYNYFKYDKSKGTKDIFAECIADDSFYVNGETMELQELGCMTVANHDAAKAGRCAGDRYTRVNIGFQLDGDFITQIENCFDEDSYDAIYSRMNMTPAIAFPENYSDRPNFVAGEFYDDVTVGSLYNQDSQKKAIGKLLGDVSLGSHYITGKNGVYLSKGTMSSKADYIQEAQQRATFYYVNAAPQWQSVIDGNWKTLEMNVRDFIIERRISVTIVTGTWGVSTLPNNRGLETPLYLGYQDEFLRIPKYYWKVVFHPETNKGVAFVGLNNPWQELKDGDVFCKDVCARYPWLKWSPQDQKKGFGFCCDVNELRKVVDTVPTDMVVKELL